MTHKTVPVEPTEKQKRLALAALLRSTYAINREGREYIAQLLEAAPPSPVTELELKAMKNALWRACGDDAETANAYLDAERQALAAYEAKKGK